MNFVRKLLKNLKLEKDGHRSHAPNSGDCKEETEKKSKKTKKIEESENKLE